MKGIMNPSLFLFFSVLIFSSCTKDKLQGSGNIITETRMLNGFESILISGNRKAAIVFSQESKVEISGYQNLIAAMRSQIINGKLSFDFPNNSVTNDNISLVIYTPVLLGVDLSGDAEMNIGSGFTGNNFNVSTSGNATVRLNAGAYNAVKFATSGTAKIFAEPFASKQAEVDVSGIAYVELRASETLKVTISGDGEVHHWGNPAVTSSISGNGKIVKH